LDFKHKQNAFDPIYKVKKEEFLHDVDSEEDEEIKKIDKISESDSLRTSN